MSKLRVGIALVLLAGVLVGATASSAVSVRSEGSDATLPLAILVNRLQLTPEQMRVVRDRLADVLTQVDAMDRKRAAFEDEMIRFDGTREELEERLTTFHEETAADHEALRETVRTAVEELKDTLTIRQGEIIAGFVREVSLGQFGAAPDQRMRSAVPRDPIFVARRGGDDPVDMADFLRGIRNRIADAREGGDRITDDSAMAELRERIEALRGRLRVTLREMPAMRRMEGQHLGGGDLPERVVDLLRQLLNILDQKLSLGGGA
ncbi:MAG: hypothetical protein JSW65_02230 [Candidatus Bipolaricaulota bacterium]|nr:MAG: hypothetical protein JSW65_02230 [Candidatus Bipolaricaulota bacterium]